MTSHSSKKGPGILLKVLALLIVLISLSLFAFVLHITSDDGETGSGTDASGQISVESTVPEQSPED